MQKLIVSSEIIFSPPHISIFLYFNITTVDDGFIIYSILIELGKF